MIWIAPSEKDTATDTLEKRLWDAADQLRANSGLKAQEYSGPILGLIFLRFAEVRFTTQRAKLEKAGASSRRGARVDEPGAYHAEGILYLPAEAGFDYLLTLKEIEAQGCSLNPGRCVGVAAAEAVSDEDFKEPLETLNEELETLNAAARELEATIAGNVAEILEA
jgi:type I restriction-modification system DNA methylase subunit